MWWGDAVIYQIYPRSFQDSDGDGVGDLPGILARLDHVKALRADAIWLSPFYRSPDADYGYDVADYEAVDPVYGTLEDFDRMVAAAHDRGLRVLVDFVPCHTSVEHPWFREHPDYYFWADAPVNNWRASFGGSAWELDRASGRYYLHSFFPEQADLNWRNPEVRAAMTGALRFWLHHGVDGFRLDAIDRLLKDTELRDDPPADEPFALPLDQDYGRLRHVHSANAPDIGLALDAIRSAAGPAFLVGEAYLPVEQLGPYRDRLDAVFAFEAMNAGPDAERLRSSITAAIQAGKLGWVLSNHDFPRFASRFGASARAAAMLFLSLPGPVFMFQGDELGTPDGPRVQPPLDRADRDRFRHPMQWDASPGGGFTSGTPWLPLVDPPARNVAEQDQTQGSVLSLFQALIGLRQQLTGHVRFLDSPAGTVVLQRGDHVVAVNFGEADAPVRREGEIVLEAHAGDGQDPLFLPPHGGWIAIA